MNPSPPSSELPAVARVFWMMIGPAILVLLTLAVGSKGSGWSTPQDLAFLIVLTAVIFARWFEFRAGNPKTTTGDPATPDDLRRYVIGASAIGLGVWIVANLIGNHWLTR